MYGHSHDYAHLPPNGLISGNGGAPLYDDYPDGKYYGYATVDQLPDGTIQVQEHRLNDGTVTDNWTVTPDGQ